MRKDRNKKIYWTTSLHKGIVPLFLIFTILVSYKTKAQEVDTTKKNHLFEISFGQSLLFISDSRQIDIRNQEAVVVPTSSLLFLTEWRPQKRLRIPVFFNIPTESKQFIVNNQLVNERASPTFGAGLQIKLFQAKIDDKSKLDFEIGPLASFLLDRKGNVRFAPILAGRVRLMRGENFVMYFGGSYSFGINALGILYGTGTIF